MSSKEHWIILNTCNLALFPGLLHVHLQFLITYSMQKWMQNEMASLASNWI